MSKQEVYVNQEADNYLVSAAFLRCPMRTNRTSINRPQRLRFTPQIIYLYRRMVAEPDPLKQFALDQNLGDGFPVWQRTFIDTSAMKMMNQPPMSGGNSGMARSR